MVRGLDSFYRFRQTYTYFCMLRLNSFPAIHKQSLSFTNSFSAFIPLGYIHTVDIKEMACLLVNKQDRQCMYRRKIEARSRNHYLFWERNMCYIFWLRVCSLSQPACKAHVPYHIFICGMSGSIIFFFHIIW
jgi:hypothetical protein